MRYARPDGTIDILPPGSGRPWVEDVSKWQWVEDTFRDLCRLYGYAEVRIPMFEATDLFHRAVGDGTDIVSKETYDFVTRGGDRLTLRPEATAGLMRAYVDARLNLERPVWKIFNIGPNFRYERKQKGRYRQHHQVDIEALGADDPAVDAEVIALAVAFFQRLGVPHLTVKVNSVGTVESRGRYIEALRAYAAPLLPQMSDDNRRRFETNALRMLDSKDARDIRLLEDAPLLSDSLDEESRTHFERLRGYLDALGIAYETDPRLVRGFDYYTKTAFEIQAPELGDKSLGGGGRYNRLVEDLGGPPTPGIGFGLGIERILIALEEAGAPGPAPRGIDAFLCPIGARARDACVTLLAQLRAAGIAADLDYTGRRVKVMLEQAEALGARFALLLGDDELAAGVAQVRDRASGDARVTALVPLDALANYLRENRE